MSQPKPLTYEFSTPAPPSALYEAISTQAGLRAWWCKDCDIAAEVGGKHALRFDKQGTRVNMGFELTELSEGRVVWKCTSNDNPVWVGSSLAWDIRSEGGDTRLTLTHDGFAGGGPPYEMTAEGWNRFVDSLKEVAEGRAGNPM